MKRVKKTVMISLLLILMIGVISGTTANVFAAAGSGLGGSRTVNGDASVGTLPSSFDLRNVDTDGDGVGDRCYVTPVKAQQPFGVCRSFAAVAGAETSLLGSVYADDPDAYKTLDLSEKAKRLADVDQDGDVCILDTTWIQRWLSDLPSKENIGKSNR